MSEHPTRILAIDPMTKGFGYVVFELPFHLVTFGRAYPSGDKNAGALARVRKLLDYIQPEAMVLEDVAAPGSLRRARVRELIPQLQKLAREHGIPVHAVSRAAVLKSFGPPGEKVTKRAIAEQLARNFPEMASQLPPRRKMWDGEHDRAAIFDALALVVTHVNG